MSAKVRPMLAVNSAGSFESVTYPMYSSPKVDGIRCLIIKGELYFRTIKPQPTLALREHLKELIDYCNWHNVVADVELYDHTKPFCWHQSTLRSFKGKMSRGLRAWLIDVLDYEEWVGEAPTSFHFKQGILDKVGTLRNVHRIPQTLVNLPEHAQRLYEEALADGYEGTMLRCPMQGYKHGRTTVGQNWLLKFKAWKDTDGKVVDVVEGVKLREGAEEREAPTGGMERSSKGEDYEPSGMMGSITVELEDGVTFGIGTWNGLTHELRRDMWEHPENYIGRWIRFKSQACGEKDRPRIPHDVEFIKGFTLGVDNVELRDDK